MLNPTRVFLLPFIFPSPKNFPGFLSPQMASTAHVCNGNLGLKTSLTSSSSSLAECFTTTSTLSRRRHDLHHLTKRLPTVCLFAKHFDLHHCRRRPNVVEILEARGLLDSLTTQSLSSVCSDPRFPPLTVYCGFDPTAESLHLGNLLAIIVLSWFLRCGHNAIAVVGGASARFGDPSGKTIGRPKLHPTTLDTYTCKISNTIQRLLCQSHYSPSPPFTILNNYDWWKDITRLDFLEIEEFVRASSVLSKKSISQRLNSEQGMNWAELNYPLIQGYDFLHLFRTQGVSVQIGGSDQWGNITLGIDLIHRILKTDGAYGLTFPLLLKSDGTKYGKSEEGAIWLSPSLLTPFKFYQYLFTVPDVDVVRLLKILTFLSMEEIAGLERDMQRPDYVPNTAQRRLAEEVTRFVHGQEGLDEALKATEALRPGTDIQLDWKKIEGIAENIPTFPLPYDQVLSLSLLDLSVRAGLVKNKSAARRLLKQGGFYLNNARVNSEEKKIQANDIIDDSIIILSAGKKNKIVVRVS